MAIAFSTTATQTVAQGQNVIFTDPISCSRNNSVVHRNGSGIFTLRGSNSCCSPAKYKVEFSGNISPATGGTAGPIGVSIALNGEPLYGATAIVTPAAVGDFFFVGPQTEITVPCGCCYTISVENTSTTATAIDVANATITITREC